MLKIDVHRWDSSLTRLGTLTNAHGRQLTCGLNKVGSLSFQLDYDNPLTATLLDEQCIVVAYKQMRDNTWSAVFAGPVEATDEGSAADGVPTVAIAAAGAPIILSRRIADDGSGIGFSVNGLKPTGIDKADFMRQLIIWANLRGNTWIRSTEAVVDGSGVTIDSEIGVGGYQTVGGLLDQVSSGGDVEWFFTPQAPTADSIGQKLGEFEAAGLIGSDKSGLIRLEYGTGLYNLQSIGVKSERQMANTVYHVRAGSEPYMVSTNNARHLRKFGLLEEVADAELEDSALRQAWTNSVASVRKGPRRFYELQLMPETEVATPRFWQDYRPGDRVRLLAYWGGATSARTVDTTLRIYDCDVSIDDAGVEQVTLGLVPGG